jgi:hypothetical protein
MRPEACMLEVNYDAGMARDSWAQVEALARQQHHYLLVSAFTAITRVQNKRLALLVILFLEGCLVILTSIKDAENGNLVSIHLERDHDAFSVAGYS